MATITTKHKGWANVERVGVRFRDGKARTSDPEKVAFFRRHADVYDVDEGKTRRNQREDAASQENSNGGDKPTSESESGGESGSQSSEDKSGDKGGDS